jgi:hypothetical protein
VQASAQFDAVHPELAGFVDVDEAGVQPSVALQVDHLHHGFTS